MAFESKWEQHGFYKRFYGHVTVAEFMESVAQLQGDSRFDQITYSINDFSDVSSHDISEIDVKIFAGYSKGAFKTNAKIRIAVISNDPEIIQLVGIFTQPNMASYVLQIFPDISAARNWLDCW